MGAASGTVCHQCGGVGLKRTRVWLTNAMPGAAPGPLIRWKHPGSGSGFSPGGGEP